jgi:cysteinyl-tRNA synthetase
MKLYDTLSRAEKEIEHPTTGDKIRFYSCGLTVYNYAHIGNLRSFLFADSIRRSLEFLGTPIDWVMNVTDVDDKTIRGTVQEYGADATVTDLRKFTDKYLDIFLEELASLNIDASSIRFIRVADVIPQIQEYILALAEKGYAYHTEDGTYFSIEKYQTDFGDYGELVGKGFLEGKKTGARVKVDEYEKDNLSDFALWKKHSPEDGQIFWDHPVLGKGRPGWHIECSVINDIAFNHTPTDIHTGGVDLVFPHHTNEIAQSQPMYKPFAKHWAHCEHLQVDNKKMAKRDGNFVVLKDIVDKVSNPLAYRYLCLQTDFRKSMNFTWESLDGAQTALHRLYRQVAELNGNNENNGNEGSNGDAYRHAFRAALEDNMNLPKALAIAWELLGDDNVTATHKRALLSEMDAVLGLGIAHSQFPLSIDVPAEVQNLATQREQARANKDFATSDSLRQQIERLGFEVLDTKSGQTLKPK